MTNMTLTQRSLNILAAICLCWQTAWADENPFVANYHAQNEGGLKSLQAEPQPEMMRGTREASDNVSMLETGFDLIGSSSFDGPEAAPELAVEHAKVIKADKILFYAKPVSAPTSGAKIQQLREIAKKKGSTELSEADLKSVGERYHHVATYWAKLPPPLLGVHVVKLRAAGEADDAAPEKGLRVIAVIKDSPAALAGLQRGDVLYRLDGVALEKAEGLSRVVRDRQGKTVEIEYAREGQAAIAGAQINKR
jgi:hypothetical protein